MRSVIDQAINAIQNMALEIQPIDIKAAPDYPVDSALILPLAITHITGGTGQADDSTQARLLLDVNCDIHLQRENIAMTYQQINQIIPDFLKRLAGNPTLDGTVQTINFPVSVTVQPVDFNGIPTHMVSFAIPLKFLETPTT